MTRSEKRKELVKLLHGCPEIMSPSKIIRHLPFGKNHVYRLLKSGELHSFIYRGGYLVSKSDLIDYLLDTSDKPSGKYSIEGWFEDNE